MYWNFSFLVEFPSYSQDVHELFLSPKGAFQLGVLLIFFPGKLRRVVFAGRSLIS